MIARAAQRLEFAEIQCEIVTSMCRAVNNRPYKIIDRLYAKLQFEAPPLAALQAVEKIKEKFVAK